MHISRILFAVKVTLLMVQQPTHKGLVTEQVV